LIAGMVRAVLRLALHVYFRRIDVDGLDNIPARGPVLLVSNHVNGLVDPLFFMDILTRPVTITAKQTLAQSPLLRFVIWALGVITFNRREDRKVGASRGEAEDNQRALAQACSVLGQGGLLCIFPEGKSHNEPALLPFKTGAAHIALEAAARGHAVTIVPAALWFVSKGRFRSDVWVRFGAPLRVEAASGVRRIAAIRVLTRELEDRVRALALTFDSRRERWVLEWAAEIALTGAADPSALGREREGAERRARMILELQERYVQLRDSARERVLALAERVQAYRHRLRKEGIEPSELFLSLSPWAALWFCVRETEILLVGFPVAAWGTLFHAAPFLLVRAVARRAARSEDHWAAFAIFPGALVFSLWYALAVVVAFIILPLLWAVALIAFSAFAGAYFLQYRDREAGAWRRLTTFVRLVLRPRWREELRRQGAALVSDIENARRSA
jgi:glycerol-3-phosphate O-acyltransferase/dihydroxyacetone phosphate acyltransferase